MTSARIALSVTAVSMSVSPFFTEDCAACILTTSAPSRLPAISKDSKVHYHKKLTEIYLVLEGEGHMELDGELVPVKPMSVIYIKPGCKHRAVGKMRIVNIPVPAFDPDDEWFD